MEKNFKEEYYKFDFYGENAQNNIENILGDYDSLSKAIDIFDMHEPDFEDMIGIPKRHAIEGIKIKIYEKYFLSWIFGRKYTGNSIILNIRNVYRVYGELIDFKVESNDHDVRFTLDNVNITHK